MVNLFYQRNKYSLYFEGKNFKIQEEKKSISSEDHSVESSLYSAMNSTVPIKHFVTGCKNFSIIVL